MLDQKMIRDHIRHGQSYPKTLVRYRSAISLLPLDCTDGPNIKFFDLENSVNRENSFLNQKFSSLAGRTTRVLGSGLRGRGGGLGI